MNTIKGSRIKDIISYQFSLSTGQDEENYFSGEHSKISTGAPSGMELKTGRYRVVGGELFRIVGGTPK